MKQVHSTICKLQEENSYALIVCDGGNEDLNKFLFQRFDHIPIITISSFQSLGKMSQRLLATRRYHRKIVLSWTKQEIIDAIHDGNLPIDLEKLEERMYFSGTCIRWLLMSNSEQVIKTIDCTIESITDYSQFLSGKVGQQSLNAVNSLSSMVELETSTILSEYIVRKVAQEATESLILLCRRILPENPSWQAWVTEMEVLSKVLQQSRLVLWNRNATEEIWDTSLKRMISDENDDTSIGPIKSLKTWLIPTKYTQGCFDALYLMPCGTLRVVQISNAISHEYKLLALVPYVVKLKCTKVEIVVICRSENVAEFHVIKLKNLTALNNALKANCEDDKAKVMSFAKDQIRWVTYENPKEVRGNL
jgi:hypothetical protein